MELHCAIDGGCRPNPGHGAVACCIKDAEGNLLKKQGKRLEGRCTNNRAEFEAVSWALELIQELYPNCTKVYLYSDSQLVVNILNEEWGIQGGGYEEAANKAIKDIANEFVRNRQVDIRWIPRGRNEEAGKIAENLAREALQEASKGKPRDWGF